MRNYKNILIGVAVLILFLGGCRSDESSPYRVLIGLEREEAIKCRNNEKLVIDAEYLTAEDLQLLHQRGNQQIFSYLNIGSLEEFRSDYKEYESLALGEYENWNQEHWVDVSQNIWQERIRKKAEELAAKGIDGFFLDNADVYYHYRRPEIYQGILTMLRQIKEMQKTTIINGGDFFVQTAMANGDLGDLADGVNQETVFTEIDFKSGSFQAKGVEEREYFQAYLKRCREYGLEVYLLEYGADEELAKKIDNYCRENGFQYEIASGIELNQREVKHR